MFLFENRQGKKYKRIGNKGKLHPEMFFDVVGHLNSL